MKNYLKAALTVFLIFSTTSCNLNSGKINKSNSNNGSFVFAVWGHGDPAKTDAQWGSVFNKFHAAGITDFFLHASPSELTRMVRLTKDKGIRIHGWIWTLNRPGDTVAQKHPDWYSVNRNGQNSLEFNPYVKYYQWLSPFSEGARKYIKSNIEAIAEVKGLASVHLDYVRYCDVILGAALQPKYNLVQDRQMPEYDFGYHPTARKEYEKIFGIDPAKMEHPELSNEWLQFRLNAVTSLVNECSEIAHKYNTKISAAVFPFPELARNMVRQDWSSWKLDIALPMLYQNFYNENLNWIGFCTKQGVKEVDGRFPIYSGLFIPALKPLQLKEAIIQAKDSGAAGVSFFSMNSLTEEHLKVIKLLNEEFNPQKH